MDARHWVQQGHVLCAVERQTLSTVVMHHLWDAGEHAAALVQGVAVFFGLGNNDMNAALACFEGDGVLAVVRLAVPDQEAGLFAGLQLELRLLASHTAMIPAETEVGVRGSQGSQGDYISSAIDQV